MSIPELQQNPLVQRVIDIFDTDGNGEIDFKGYFIESRICTNSFCFLEFISGISQFSVKGDKESKLRCAYMFTLLTINERLILYFSCF